MTERVSGWLLVCAAIVVQFLLEVTLGRIIVAPAILVPVLVYLTISESDYWAIEGAFWSGLVLDLLLHQPFGVSSISMLCGIALSNWLLRVTTGALRMTFFINALLSSVLSDLLFIFLAARPAGSEFSVATVLIIPRILVPLLLYIGVSLLFGRSGRQFR